MLCPKCRFVEMRIESVNNNQVKHYCKKCGNEVITVTSEGMTNENQL